MILSVGTSYRTGSVELLERLAVDETKLSSVLRHLYADENVDEVLLLSTCNRVEMYASGSGRRVIPVMADWFLDRIGPLARKAHGTLRVRHQDTAVAHLLSVACGLDSMALGEDQVAAQLRQAFRRAQEAGTVGPVLGELVETALRTSKRARSQTPLNGAGRSLVHAGLRLAHQNLGGLGGRAALVVGTGAMGALAGRLLVEAGAAPMVVSSRTLPNAERLAAAVDAAQVVPLADLHLPLARSEVVVTATAAPGYVVTGAMMRAARSGEGPPAFVLDLAIPRDVDPACRAMPGVTVVDIEDLGRYLSADGVPPGVAEAQVIVSKEAERFMARRREAAVSPLITALHSRVRADVEAELSNLYRRFPALTAEERAATAAAVNRIIARMLHRPTIRAKELAAASGGQHHVEALFRLFDLDPESTVDEFAGRAE